MSKIKTKKIKSSKQPTLGQKIGKVLGNYLTTQFVLMVIVGFASWGILTLLKVDYAVLLAIITGVLSGVPGFGMFISTVVTGIVAILDKSPMWTNSPAWLEGLIVVAIFFVFNKIIDLVVAPIFLGKTTKINPLIVILLITLGTIFFGVLGAILAVPLYLVIKTIIEHFSGQ